MEPSKSQASQDQKMVLPMSIYSPSDISRLVRELDNLENQIMQEQIRSKESKLVLPKVSQQLNTLADVNKVDLSERTHRQTLQTALAAVKQKAPVVHISFSSEPSAGFMEKIATWFRQQTNPYVLLTVGLQPSIAVGCVVRTPNKQFDLSLGKDLLKKSDLLISKFSLKEQETASGRFMPVKSAPEGQS